MCKEKELNITNIIPRRVYGIIGEHTKHIPIYDEQSSHIKFQNTQERESWNSLCNEIDIANNLELQPCSKEFECELKYFGLSRKHIEKVLSDYESSLSFTNVKIYKKGDDKVKVKYLLDHENLNPINSQPAIKKIDFIKKDKINSYGSIGKAVMENVVSINTSPEVIDGLMKLLGYKLVFESIKERLKYSIDPNTNICIDRWTSGVLKDLEYVEIESTNQDNNIDFDYWMEQLHSGKKKSFMCDFSTSKLITLYKEYKKLSLSKTFEKFLYDLLSANVHDIIDKKAD